MDVSITYSNTRFAIQIEYTFRLIFDLLGLKTAFIPYAEAQARTQQGNGVIISYGFVKPNVVPARHIHVYESDFWNKGYLTDASLPQGLLQRYRDLPVLYSAEVEGKEFVIEEYHRGEILIDIVASVFFLASQYEAVVQPKHDRHGRFPASASLAVREDFLQRPLVHEYAELLWAQVKRLVPEAKRRTWLLDADCAVLVSHDVDVFRKYSTHSLLGCLLGRAGSHNRSGDEMMQFLRGFMRARFRGQQDPYQSFGYLLDREAQAGCRSSFHFRAGRGSSFDGPTYLHSRIMRSVLSAIQTNGCEIGLHGSYHSAYSSRKVQRERSRLESITGQPIVGNRFHYLRFRIPDTWRYLEQAGLRYDATLGFAEHEGFRCGLCLPFRPYDLLENRESCIWEIPLIVMDTTLRFHRGLGADVAFEPILNLLETVKRFKGVLVIVWHNSSFDEQLWPGWRRVFEDFLDHIRNERLFCGTGAEIIAKWERYVQQLAPTGTGYGLDQTVLRKSEETALEQTLRNRKGRA